MIDRTKRIFNGTPHDVPGRQHTAQEQREHDDGDLIACIAPGCQWGVTISPIRSVAHMLSDDELTQLKNEAGFWHMARFGARHALVSIDVFHHETDQNAFFAELNIGDLVHPILLQSLPALLRLLRDVEPAIRMGREAEND